METIRGRHTSGTRLWLLLPTGWGVRVRVKLWVSDGTPSDRPCVTHVSTSVCLDPDTNRGPFEEAFVLPTVGGKSWERGGVPELVRTVALGDLSTETLYPPPRQRLSTLLVLCKRLGVFRDTQPVVAPPRPTKLSRLNAGVGSGKIPYTKILNNNGLNISPL